MTEEIHITVPKGAKVIIHEEDEPEAERSLEERIDELLKLLEAMPKPEKEYVFIPYPVLPAPQIVPMPYPVPYYPQPYRTAPSTAPYIPPNYVGDVPNPPYIIT